MNQIGYDLMYALHPSATAKTVYTWLLIDVEMSLRPSGSEDVMHKFSINRFILTSLSFEESDKDTFLCVLPSVCLPISDQSLVFHVLAPPST